MIHADANLLFGVLALQADLISNHQFVEACGAWAARKDVSLAELLLARGWISPEDKADVNRLLQRKMKKHNGDVRASLAEAANDSVRHTLAGIGAPAIQQSLAGLTSVPQPCTLPAPPPTCRRPARATP